MIITVDPSQSEDIAAFAMVKQYRMQALNVTLNGGTGSSAWQAVQGGEGYTQTVVTPVTGIELVYEDPNAIVSYTVENDDTSNYDAASNAGIILSSIEPTTNAWTYTCVFHADSVPVSSVDIDLLVYGNIARGTEQQGSPATAEEITAQVLAGLETRVTALEEEMPTKADVATTYTKTEADTLLGAKANDNAVVKRTGAQTVQGVKTFISDLHIKKNDPQYSYLVQEDSILRTEAPSAVHRFGVRVADKNGSDKAGIAMWNRTDGGLYLVFEGYPIINGSPTYKRADIIKYEPDGTGYMTGPSRDYAAGNTSDVATIKTLDQYAPMVRTTGDQNIRGIKSINQAIINCLSSTKVASTPFLLYKHGRASTTQDYRGYLLVTKTNPPVAELIHLDYSVNVDTNAVTMSPNCRVQVIDGDSTNTSTYSVFVDNSGLVNVAITSGTGQAVSCMVLQMWVGGRFGVTSDMSTQGTETTIPTNHGEVTL